MRGAVTAQPVQASEVDYYPNEIGDNVLVSAEVGYGTLMYYTDAADRSYFLYRPNNDPTNTYKFLWPNHSSINNTKYIIHDMEVIKDACYLCGSKLTLNLLGGFDTIGLVGRVDIHDIDDSPRRIEFCLCPIPSTKVFTQLDGYNNNLINLSLVGQCYLSNLRPSCAAFVEWNSNLLKYNVVRLNTMDETLTDIAFSKDGKKVVSVSRVNNMPYWFVLRCDNFSNLFIFPPIPFSAPYYFGFRNVFNTSGLTLGSSFNPNPTWHENDVVARIVGHDALQYFTVAYECVDATNICGSQRMVAMFKVDVSTTPVSHYMSITDQQAVHGYLNERASFVGMRYWFTTQDKFALLYRSENSKKNFSVFSFPLWGTYGYMPILLSDQEIFQSATMLGTSLLMGGKRVSNGDITYSFQDTEHLDVSCHSTRPNAFTEELIGSALFNFSKNTVVVHDRDTQRFTPTIIYSSSTPVQQNTCKSYYVQ